jgi:phospholipase/lecithinase/hemolysin
MRRHFGRLSTLLLVGLASVMAQAATPRFDALYVFGDSYCDVGNIFAATGGAVPAAPYYNGRFSDGPIWLDHVAGFLGVPMKAYIQGGTNYAFGGAWVTAPQTIPGGVIPSVPQQVGLYLSLHEGKADPNALYVLEGGGNDILNTTTGSPEALGYQIASGIAGSERMLRQAGARHFVVPNLFNVGILPAAAGNITFANAASVATNKWTSILLENEMNLPGIQILHMDIFSLFGALETDPTHFGFSDVTNPCLTTTSLCSDPDHRLFWDDHHPTLFGHMMFAVTLENALTSHTE